MSEVEHLSSHSQTEYLGETIQLIHQNCYILYIIANQYKSPTHNGNWEVILCIFHPNAITSPAKHPDPVNFYTLNMFITFTKHILNLF
jgi:hypothetical protein